MIKPDELKERGIADLVSAMGTGEVVPLQVPEKETNDYFFHGTGDGFSMDKPVKFGIGAGKLIVFCPGPDSSIIPVYMSDHRENTANEVPSELGGNGFQFLWIEHLSDGFPGSPDGVKAKVRYSARSIAVIDMPDIASAHISVDKTQKGGLPVNLVNALGTMVEKLNIASMDTAEDGTPFARTNWSMTVLNSEK